LFSVLDRHANDSVQICACAPALRSLVKRHLSSEKSVVGHVTRKVLKKEKKATTSTSSTASRFASYPDSLYYRSFDLEGIAVDGYGYVVTITAGDGGAQRRKSHKFWPFARKDVEEGSWSVDRPSFDHLGGSTSEKPAIEIVTTRSMEMRESFYAGRDSKMSHF
jgi:hypothetical protein